MGKESVTLEIKRRKTKNVIEATSLTRRVNFVGPSEKAALEKLALREIHSSLKKGQGNKGRRMRDIVLHIVDLWVNQEKSSVAVFLVERREVELFLEKLRDELRLYFKDLSFLPVSRIVGSWIVEWKCHRVRLFHSQVPEKRTEQLVKVCRGIHWEYAVVEDKAVTLDELNIIKERSDNVIRY